MRIRRNTTMLVHATTESVSEGRFSILAIAECVIAVAVYVAIGFHYQTFLHYVIAVILAPLLLLRTQESTDTALAAYSRFCNCVLKWFSEFLAKRDEKIPKAAVVAVGVFVMSTEGLLIALGGSCIRVGATAWTLLRHPIATLRAMPRNWVRQSLCTDITIPPEIVPNEATYNVNAAAEYGIMSFDRVIVAFRKSYSYSGIGRFMAVAAALPLLILGYIPSFCLRLSFKATSIVYVPFIWITRFTLNELIKPKSRLERFTRSEIEKTRRAISLIIFSCVLLKIFYLAGLLTFDDIVAKLPSRASAEIVIGLGRWQLWQALLVLEATLTYIIFYAADAVVARITAEQEAHTSTMVHGIQFLSFVRASLAVFTIAYAISVFVLIAYQQNPLGLAA